MTKKTWIKFFTYALSICPDKIIFVPDKIFFVPNKIFFVLDKTNFVRDKNLVLSWKRTYLLVKWMENDFLATDKIFPTLKSHFPSISQAKMYFFSLGQFFFVWDKNVLSRTKVIFVRDKNYFVRDKNYFVQDKNYFVRADGQGICMPLDQS